MGFNSFISKIFGNKASRDMREIQPWVEKIKAAHPRIQAMSNDELRAASEALKQKIQGSVVNERAKIAELKASIEDTELEKREAIFNQIDKLEKELKDAYTPKMKKLSLRQGKLLIKLVDRQCDQNAYQLIKLFMGSFKAVFYQSFASLFGASLKKSYDPMGEDSLTERVVIQVLSGEL